MPWWGKAGGSFVLGHLVTRTNDLVLFLKMLGAYQNTRALHEIPKENLTFLSFPDEESNGLVRNGGYYGDELGFPGGSDSKESACNAGDLGLIPGSGRSPGEGNCNPL